MTELPDDALARLRALLKRLRTELGFVAIAGADYRQVLKTLDAMTQELDAALLPGLAAFPAHQEDEHDPLCSLGTRAGDQTMPCDCAPRPASTARDVPHGNQHPQADAARLTRVGGDRLPAEKK